MPVPSTFGALPAGTAGPTRGGARPGSVARERGTPGRHSRPYRGGARPGAVARERGTPRIGCARGGGFALTAGSTHRGHGKLPGKTSPQNEAVFSIGFTGDRRITDPRWAPKSPSECAPGKLFSGRKFQRCTRHRLMPPESSRSGPENSAHTDFRASKKTILAERHRVASVPRSDARRREYVVPPEHSHAERGNEFKCFDSVGLRQENQDVPLRRAASRSCLLVDKCSKYA